MRRHVAIVGFMAAGKTTVGRRLARHLGLPFRDTDALIAARHGEIASIFAGRGEAAFRACEHEALLEALGGEPAVIALGGGALTHEPTRLLVRERMLRVYLDLSPAALVQRLHRSRVVRPLMGRAPTLESVRELLARRDPQYREAEIVVRGSRRSAESFAREIAAIVRTRAEFAEALPPPPAPGAAGLAS